MRAEEETASASAQAVGEARRTDGARRSNVGGRDPGRRAGGREPAILTDLETEVMQVLWKLGTATAGEMRETLAATRPLALTTVLTVLGKLREKKVVRLVPTIGRAMKFRAVVPRAAVAGRSLRGLLERFFNGSPASLMAHLVKEGDLDDAEMKEIRRLLSNSTKEGDGK